MSDSIVCFSIHKDKVSNLVSSVSVHTQVQDDKPLLRKCQIELRVLLFKTNFPLTKTCVTDVKPQMFYFLGLLGLLQGFKPVKPV